jgi:D-aminoacyl-tRNA deacylase
MIAVLQRVVKADVRVNGEVKGAINRGILVLLGVEQNDTELEAEYLARKTIELRIFPDENNHMNRSLSEICGEALIVSQFTLLADCRKGRRPSFAHAADPDLGKSLYDYFTNQIRKAGIVAATGVFGAIMNVNLVNDGPVTMILDSRCWKGERIPVRISPQS